MNSEHDPGDEWTNHYRGYRLQTNPDGEVWWQAYQGTDRLFLEPVPETLVEALLELKHLGGRVRITEDGDVLTRLEEGDSYETVWVGEISLSGELVPVDEPEFSIPVTPSAVEPGDLWPSVYDGAKYSFGPGGDRVWWSNPETHKRHPVQTPLESSLQQRLTRFKPRGGSFRVTPWNDVLTLVDVDKLPSGAQAAFDDLPRVVKNIISLRKDRGGVSKIPVYVGEADTTPFKISEPPSLTDPISSEDMGFDSWTESLGTTSSLDPEDHTATESTGDSTSGAPDRRDGEDEGDDDSLDIPDDDPIDW